MNSPLLRTLNAPVTWAVASILYDVVVQRPSDGGPNGLIVIGIATIGVEQVARTSGAQAGVAFGLARAFLYLGLVLAWRAIWQEYGGPVAWSFGAWRPLLFLVGVAIVGAGWSARAGADRRSRGRPADSNVQAI